MLVTNVSNYQSSNRTHQKCGTKNHEAFHQVGIVAWFFRWKKDIRNDVAEETKEGKVIPLVGVRLERTCEIGFKSSSSQRGAT
jgi:hypothetical protein